ncbi:MAG: MotA/TolQ/ExbB proton channel family protein [Verrucomicrobiae bacterium]|nr:MotA/TolQ/ExbB proton channel family protein [Verrucomicrobiae bacterium]
MNRINSPRLSAWISLLFLQVLGVVAACGQDGAGQAPGSGQNGPAPVAPTVDLLEVVRSGGVVMVILGVLSVIAVALIVFYALTIRKNTVASDYFMDSAEDLIRRQDYVGLLAVCQKRSESVAKIIQKTLEFATRNPTATFEEVKEVTEAEGSRQTSILIQRVSYLADIGAIAPMIGLLGTVIGMIKEFNSISQGTNIVGAPQMKLAGGVAEALVTTAGGLVIAVPALIFYALFRGRVNRLISELEAATTHLMATLSAQYKLVTARTNQRSRASARAISNQDNGLYRDD